MFLLFGAANTLGFLDVSETLGHIGDPPDHFGTIFDNFFSFGLRSFSTNFPEKSYVPTRPAENGRGGGGLSPPLPFWDLEEASLLPSQKWEGRRASVFARVKCYLHIQQQIRQKKLES